MFSPRVQSALPRRGETVQPARAVRGKSALPRKGRVKQLFSPKKRAQTKHPSPARGLRAVECRLEPIGASNPLVRGRRTAWRRCHEYE